jgi:hypothetical protein
VLFPRFYWLGRLDYMLCRTWLSIILLVQRKQYVEFGIDKNLTYDDHRGGTLELGMDKCEYCGQVLLS